MMVILEDDLVDSVKPGDDAKVWWVISNVITYYVCSRDGYLNPYAAGG